MDVTQASLPDCFVVSISSTANVPPQLPRRSCASRYICRSASKRGPPLRFHLKFHETNKLYVRTTVTMHTPLPPATRGTRSVTLSMLGGPKAPLGAGCDDALRRCWRLVNLSACGVGEAAKKWMGTFVGWGVGLGSLIECVHALDSKRGKKQDVGLVGGSCPSYRWRRLRGRPARTGLDGGCN
jgi:hypothetical protein